MSGAVGYSWGVACWLDSGARPPRVAGAARAPPLQEWLRHRPALMKLDDDTLVQHCGTDTYATLVESLEPDPVAAINTRVHQLLASEHESKLWDAMSGHNIFATSAERLDRWLDITGGSRVDFGHHP